MGACNPGGRAVQASAPRPCLWRRRYRHEGRVGTELDLVGAQAGEDEAGGGLGFGLEGARDAEAFLFPRHAEGKGIRVLANCR